MLSPENTNDNPPEMITNDLIFNKVPQTSIHQSKSNPIRNKHFVVSHNIDSRRENYPTDILNEFKSQPIQKRIKRRNAVDFIGPTKNECFVLRHRFLLLQSRQPSEEQEDHSPRSTTLKNSFTNRILGSIQQKTLQLQWITGSITSNSTIASQNINRNIWRCFYPTELNEEEEEDGVLEDIPQEIKEKAKKFIQEQDRSNLWSFTNHMR